MEIYIQINSSPPNVWISRELCVAISPPIIHQLSAAITTNNQPLVLVLVLVLATAK
jgi:hypothetical protein